MPDQTFFIAPDPDEACDNAVLIDGGVVAIARLSSTWHSAKVSVHRLDDGAVLGEGEHTPEGRREELRKAMQHDIEQVSSVLH